MIFFANILALHRVMSLLAVFKRTPPDQLFYMLIDLILAIARFVVWIPPRLNRIPCRGLSLTANRTFERRIIISVVIAQFN